MSKCCCLDPRQWRCVRSATGKVPVFSWPATSTQSTLNTHSTCQFWLPESTSFHEIYVKESRRSSSRSVNQTYSSIPSIVGKLEWAQSTSFKTDGSQNLIRFLFFIGKLLCSHLLYEPSYEACRKMCTVAACLAVLAPILKQWRRSSSHCRYQTSKKCPKCWRNSGGSTEGFLSGGWQPNFKWHSHLCEPRKNESGFFSLWCYKKQKHQRCSLQNFQSLSWNDRIHFFKNALRLNSVDNYKKPFNQSR